MPPRKRAEPKPGNITALPPATEATLAQVLDHRELLAVLDAAAGEMTWLKSSDGALLELARRYAGAIDDAVSISRLFDEIRDQVWDMAEATDSKSLMKRFAALEKAADVGKTVAWVGPLLANVLRDLGGAPGERKGLEGDAPVKSKLQQLREANQAAGGTSARKTTARK